MGEDVVAIFHGRVAGEAGFVQPLVARLSVLKVSEPPAARRGVLLGILDHELDIHGGPDNERLSAGEWTGQDFVVVFRRGTSPMKRGNDGAVWERERPFLKGLESYIVTELSAQLVGLAWYEELVHGDHFPIAVSGGDFDSVDRGGVPIGLSRCVGNVGDNSGKGCNCNQQKSDSFHDSSFHSSTSLNSPALEYSVPSNSNAMGRVGRSSKQTSQMVFSLGTIECSALDAMSERKGEK